MIRQAGKKLQARASVDGDGVSIQRWSLMGRSDSDPFLMIDEFRLYQGEVSNGFPEHPHRGFETVTLMHSGGMHHRDHMGHNSRIGPGELQWMTAGSGVIHEEIPDTSEEAVRGLQLWVNLPREDKWTDPAYVELKRGQIPQLDLDGATLRVLAGEHKGVRSRIQRPKLDLVMIELSLEPGANIALQLPQSQLLWLQQTGTSESAGSTIKAGELWFYAAGDEWRMQAGDHSSVSGLLLAAEPLQEPIAHYGPFVMNSREDIDQALNDYRAGRLVR